MNRNEDNPMKADGLFYFTRVQVLKRPLSHAKSNDTKRFPDKINDNRRKINS